VWKPRFPGEFPTLGHQVADWIADRCAVPDGERMGEPFVLTPEQLRFVLWHYRLHPDAAANPATPSAPFVFRRSQIVRPQKWGKGPLGAALICAEAAGPVLFDGWDADGRPVGRPWVTPWIQVTACSEDQTDNVYRALLPMIELGRLGLEVPDTGETRINLPGGGRIEPVTAAQRSRLGQRITFSLQDQTESWFSENGGHALADNQRRNLAGMGGRSVETPNAWDPAEHSVAQRTFEANTPDVHKDYPDAPPGSFTDKRQRRKILVAVYGDSAVHKGGWVDLDRIDAEAVELIESGERAQAERWFGNRSEAGQDAAFDPDRWAELARPGLWVAGGRKELATLGFAGARFHDATGLVVTLVEQSHQIVFGEWQADRANPEIESGPVTEAVGEAFDTFDVWRMYANPTYWADTIDAWAGRFGEKRVLAWWINRPKPMAYALRNYHDAMSGDTPALTHDGNATFARHVGNARRRATRMRDEEGRYLWTISKPGADSPRLIDLAIAGCLSWEARGDAIAAGVLRPQSKEMVCF
jgi:hypothetical protein